MSNKTKEPDYWHVVDQNGESIYSASFKQACVDHINDSLLADEWNSDIGLWRVEGLYVKPQNTWKPIAEALHGRQVLVKSGNEYCIAIYPNKYQLKASDELESKYCDYCEKTDTYYCKPGWYEKAISYQDYEFESTIFADDAVFMEIPE